MLRKAILVLALGLGAASYAAAGRADTLIIDGIGSRSAGSGMPTAGITKSKVVAEWGEPATKVAAVGEPPISRWDYGEFVVYFEYDHVIHSVKKR